MRPAPTSGPRSASRPETQSSGVGAWRDPPAADLVGALAAELARRGRGEEALHHLNEYLRSLPESSSDARRIESLIERIRAGDTLDPSELEGEDVG